MELNDSLLPLKEPAICPCLEPAQSDPRPPNHFFKTHFNSISHLRASVPSGLCPCGLCPCGLPHKTHVCDSSLPHMCYMSRQSHGL